MKRIQFLISYVYLCFDVFSLKYLSMYFFGLLKVTYVLKIFGYSKSINLYGPVRNYKQQLANAMFFKSVHGILSSRVHEREIL
jgi:hypothetical protein